MFLWRNVDNYPLSTCISLTPSYLEHCIVYSLLQLGTLDVSHGRKTTIQQQQIIAAWAHSKGCFGETVFIESHVVSLGSFTCIQGRLFTKHAGEPLLLIPCQLVIGRVLCSLIGHQFVSVCSFLSSTHE